MKSGLVYIAVETYDSDRFHIGFTIDTNVKTLYDNIQSMKLPSILTFYSSDIERDEIKVTNALREKNQSGADAAIDCIAEVFKSKLSNVAPQILDDETKRMLDAMLADSDDD